MAKKVTTLGTVLQLKIASTFTTIPGLITLTPPNPTRPTIEFGELNQEVLVKRTGAVDPGECAFEVHLDPADEVHIELAEAFADRKTLREWNIIYSDDDETPEPFKGFLTENSKPSFDQNGKLVGSYKVVCTPE